MKKKRKQARQPMLYIAQPKLKKPAASMQTDFRTPKQKQASAQEKKDEKSIKSKPRMKNKSANDIQNQTDDLEQFLDDDENHKNDDQTHLKRKHRKRKKFNDMTLDEKVDYFVGLPQHVPKMKCEIRTKEQRLRGVITDYKDGKVHMVTYKHPRQRELDMDDIESISLISL